MACTNRKGCFYFHNISVSLLANFISPLYNSVPNEEADVLSIVPLAFI